MDSLLATVAALLVAGAPAPESPDGWVALDPQVLDTERGGFATPGGLQVDVGIRRLVSINGQLVVEHQYFVSGSALGPQALVQPGMAGGPTLVQNGAGNHFEAAIEAPGALVIQNTLSNQAIRSETVINATVNSMSLVKSMNFNESVGHALAGALRSQ